MQADTRWFHVFRTLFESGDVARMGCIGFAVYACIKAYTNLQSGVAFPGVETIAERCGISSRQVIRELHNLEKLGYVTKAKHGRHNVYQLREQVAITDGTGQAIAQASWDYIPALVQTAVADIRQVLLSGDLAGAKVVHIEQLNIQVNLTQPGATANNLQIPLADALKAIKDPGLRAQLASLTDKALADDR
jgi:hypothetical protein